MEYKCLILDFSHSTFAKRSKLFYLAYFEIGNFVFCLEKLCNEELHLMNLVSFNDLKENENY